jgi:hypothetical protein
MDAEKRAQAPESGACDCDLISGEAAGLTTGALSPDINF